MLTHCSSEHTQNIPVIQPSKLKFHGTHPNKIFHYNLFRKKNKTQSTKKKKKNKFKQSKKFHIKIDSPKKMNLVTYEQKSPQQKMKQ